MGLNLGGMLFRVSLVVVALTVQSVLKDRTLPMPSTLAAVEASQAHTRGAGGLMRGGATDVSAQCEGEVRGGWERVGLRQEGGDERVCIKQWMSD